jgi:hypothetical protein
MLFAGGQCGTEGWTVCLGFYEKRAYTAGSSHTPPPSRIEQLHLATGGPGRLSETAVLLRAVTIGTTPPLRLAVRPFWMNSPTESPASGHSQRTSR